MPAAQPAVFVPAFCSAKRPMTCSSGNRKRIPPENAGGSGYSPLSARADLRQAPSPLEPHGPAFRKLARLLACLDRFPANRGLRQTRRVSRCGVDPTSRVMFGNIDRAQSAPNPTTFICLSGARPDRCHETLCRHLARSFAYRITVRAPVSRAAFRSATDNTPTINIGFSIYRG